MGNRLKRSVCAGTELILHSEPHNLQGRGPENGLQSTTHAQQARAEGEPPVGSAPARAGASAPGPPGSAAVTAPCSVRGARLTVPPACPTQGARQPGHENKKPFKDVVLGQVTKIKGFYF